MSRYLFLLLPFVFIACASKPLTDDERNIHVLRKSDPPANCKQIGLVESFNYSAFSEEGHEDNLRRQTVKLGGNTLAIDRYDEGTNTMRGHAYACPKSN